RLLLAPRCALIALCMAGTTLFAAQATAGPNEDAAQLLQRAGVSRGICVVVGDSGELSLALVRASELTVFTQSPREEDAALARKAADAAGLLGTRIYVQKGSARHI